MRRDLDVSYFDLDGIVHLLLALADDAYDRAIASGRVPEVPALVNEPTVAESVQLLADHRAQEGILQLIGRRDANAPLGAIAFRLTLDQCEFLSARCQEVANELRQTSETVIASLPTRVPNICTGFTAAPPVASRHCLSLNF